MLLEKKQRVRLREKKLEDASQDYVWRCDRELSRLDGMSPIDIPLNNFLDHLRDELNNPAPEQRRFAIETSEGKHIGNCMFYDMQEFRGETEIGILIGDRIYWDKGYGKEAVDSLLAVVFNNSSIQRVILKTLSDNIRAQRCFLKCGFVASGTMLINDISFITMEVNRSRWLGKSRKLYDTTEDE